MITFCFDKIADEYYGYPNLATWEAEPYTPQWRQFDHKWPSSVPLRLLMYFKYNNIPYRLIQTDDAVNAWYPIALGWFNFECDYIGLIPVNVINKIKSNQVKILFYYHEGDNPARIKEKIDQLCFVHGLNNNCYIFISANSAADQLENFIYFPDHEFFFRHLNKDQLYTPNFDATRKYDFTLLSRTHKWWRATCVADLVQANILKNSLWSYNTLVDIGDAFNDNPIEIDSLSNGREMLQKFIANGPYICDDTTADQQNNHHWVNTQLFEQSNIHIILETHFDADQSNGTFLTEKTFKPIKFGQPFIIVGPPGSLQSLREAGYRTFDHCIPSEYDTINNNTDRWIEIKKTLQLIINKGASKIFSQSRSDIIHNQVMFFDRSQEPLNKLKRKLLCRN